MPLRRRGSQARRRPERRVAVPAPLSQPDDAFERLVENALDGLPADIQALLENVAIVVEDEPPVGEDDLYGLYEGVPATEWAADWAALPNKITLFRLPLQQDFPDPRDLTDEVRRTVLHELAHHAGLDETRLHELNLD